VTDEQRDPSVADLLAQVVRRAAQRGKREIERAADAGRQQLELRQARADLEDFWIRLGKTAYRLSEAGEIEHPALDRARDRIDRLRARISELDGGAPDGDGPTD
jgi:hypothetical protein